MTEPADQSPTDQSRNPTKIDLPEPATGEPAPVGAGSADAIEDRVSAAPAPVGAAAAKKVLEEKIVEAIETVFDPEIPVNIYALGLIYGIEVQDDFDVNVKMTLTSPACPVAGSLPGEVEQKVKSVAGVRSAEVELVWDPAWNPDMMSEAAKLELGMF